ncbi:MAG: response regulator [Gemmataceae bacterium]|nr:response regulator [Gemmataceae bacterium]
MPAPKPSMIRAALVVAGAVLACWAMGLVVLCHLAESGKLSEPLFWPVAALLGGLLAAVGAAGLMAARALARTSSAAAESETAARNRLIVDAAADAILTFDFQGRIESFNAAAVRMFGFEPEEVLGQDISIIIGTSDKSDVQTMVQSAIDTGGAKVLADSAAFVGKRKDRTTFPVELGVSKVIDADRRLFVQIIRDLSERKQADRQRRMQLECARVLADGAGPEDAAPEVLAVIGESVGWPVGLLWRVDEGSGMLRCAASWAANEAGMGFVASLRDARLPQGTGLAGRVWLRRDMRWLGQVAAGPDMPAAGTALEAGLRSAIAWPVELEGRLLGVLEFYAPEIPKPDDAMRGCLVPVATQLAQFLRRKEDEAALREALGAAQEASRAKSEFLANISHEIRTPLNGIVGLTDLTLAGELAPQPREHLELVQSSANTLLSLVNDLLDFAKIEAARMELESVPFAIRPSLEPTLKALGARARQKGLSFTHHLAPEVPDWLVGDPLRLQQVLFNLVGNAIKFTPSGEVSVQVLLAARTAREAVVHGIVKDTGIGIPPDRQEAVFEAFSQADGSKTRKFGGTGLGLTIASRLVQLMGGRIWVESKAGKGSTFHFTACLATTDEAAVAAPTGGTGTVDDSHWAMTVTPEADVFGRRVLVAEDNQVNCVLLDLILQKRHHKTVFVGTGTEAVRAWKEGAFDLVLMDVQLPEMDGLEATRQIRAEAERQGKAAMVVGLTALASAEDRENCIQAGMTAYLAKPMQPRELLETIDRLLRGKR